MTRDFRKPVSYCCEQMKSHLENGADRIIYIWSTREYHLKSIKTPGASVYVFLSAEFCPWCGKNIGDECLLDEYIEAYEKAKKEDPTLPHVPYHFEFQNFQEKLLRD